jgi:hypothetical protein
MRDESGIIKQIIKRHGPIINLEENPEIIIDIIRIIGFVENDDGGPGDGAPPPGPPGPASHEGTISNVDLMKEILKVKKLLFQLQKNLIK